MAKACEICSGAVDRVKKRKGGVSAKQRKKNMGLLTAAYVGHIECLEEFMEAGADVNCEDNSFNWRYRNHLHATAKCSFNADYAHYENTSWSPLIYAVAHDHQEITKLLVKEGADVNLVLENVTALLCAVGRGNHILVEFLVQQGADVNIANKSPEVEPPIVMAVTVGSRKCLDILLNAGADVNVLYSIPDDDATPVSEAVECETLECLSMLLDAGADVNLRAASRAPIHEAVIKGNVDCLKMLLDAGADVNDIDESGKTPVIYAAEYGKKESIDLLTRQGADVNVSDEIGFTALMYAVGARHHTGCSYRSAYDCVLALTKAGVDVNVTTYFVGLCKSPLFEAIKWGGVGIVRLLLKNGAQINHRDDKGRNSLELSFRKEGNKAEDLQKLLYAAGETLDMHTCHRRDAHMNTSQHEIPENFKELKRNLDIKHLCRQAIRKHLILIHLDPHKHLFGRIPQLGLSSIVTEYMLYDCKLDSDESDYEAPPYGSNDDDNYYLLSNISSLY